MGRREKTNSALKLLSPSTIVYFRFKLFLLHNEHNFLEK